MATKGVKMKNFLEILKNVPLFAQIDERELNSLTKCLNAKHSSYEKGDFILSQGDSINGVGIILTGSVDIIKEDFLGKRSIMANLSAPDFFGEVFVCAGITTSPVSVVASQETEVMLIDYKRIITTCSSSCDHHNLLVQNMLKLIANKNLVLNRKIDYLLIKSLREKIAKYLIDFFSTNNSASFEIPFDRSELADFLNVDRSALSRELSRMKSEKLIDYKKKSFHLLKLEALE